MKQKYLLQNMFQQKMMGWIVCISAGLFFSYELIQMHMLNSISPFIIKEFNLSATSFSYLSASYLLADVCFLIPAGMLLDRYATRHIILVAMGFCIVGTFGFAFSQNIYQASICHFLSGIGNAFCFLSCMMLVAKWFDAKRQAFVVGIVVTIGLLGGVIAQTPFSMLAHAYSWRETILLDGLLGIVIFAINYTFVHDAPQNTTTKRSTSTLGVFEGLKSALANPQNSLCGLYTGIMNLPIMIIGAMWGSLFLTQIHHLELTQASLVVSMICLGTIVGAPIVGHLSVEKFTKRSLMFTGAASSLIIMLTILFIPNHPQGSLLILFFLLGLFSSTQVLGYPLIMASNPPHLTGTSMGLAALIIMGLAGLCQILSGYLLDFGWSGLIENSIPIYSIQDFSRSFSLFVIGFLASMSLVLAIKESKKAAPQGA